MNYNISVENLTRLFSEAIADIDTVKMISDCMKSFANYHEAIYELEIWLKLHNPKNTSTEEYQHKQSELAHSRTVCHNAALASINILNRMASSFGIGEIYCGTVSEERPYRTEVADAILDYIGDVMLKRHVGI